MDLLSIISNACLCVLTREMYEALKRDAPEVIAEFQADVLHFLADRVADNLNVMEAVLRADE